MKKEKYYFKDEDSISCHPLSWHIKQAENEGLKNIELIEAVPDFDNPEFTFCGYINEAVERSACNKTDCDSYKPAEGKGCEHKGRYFEFGVSKKFKV